MIEVEDLAWVRFSAPDLQEMADFLTDFGMHTAYSEKKLLATGLKSSLPLHITERGSPAFLGFAFRVASGRSMEALAALPGARSVQPSGIPGVDSSVMLADPDGFELEFVYCPDNFDRLASGPVRNEFNRDGRRERLGLPVHLERGPSPVLRLGHVVLFVADFARSDAFYSETLGLIDSEVVVDRERGVPRAAFKRCNRGDRPTDHHTLMIAQADRAGFNHAAFEVPDFDSLMCGHEHLRVAGYEHVWGVGRHILGSQIFDYWNDPWGHRLEHWTDGDLYSAEEPPRTVTREVALGVHWGPKLKP